MSFFEGKNFLEIGSISITMYAFCILTGIIIAGFQAVKEGKRIGLSPQILLDGILMCVPLAIIGARIFYVIFELENYDTFYEMIDLTSGGLGITGGIIVAVIFVIVYCRHLNINYHKVFDVVAPGLLIGQIFGRWGNFFNQEAHGGETTQEFLSSFLPDFIVDKMYISGTYWHPTFLYESIWNFIGLMFILIIRKKKTKLQLGDFLAFYLVWYGFGRGVLIEPFRTDQLQFNGIPVNVVIPILMCIGGVIYFIIKHKYMPQPTYYDCVNEVNLNRIKLFVFDIDQTLVDVDNLVDEAYQEVLGDDYNEEINYVFMDPKTLLNDQQLLEFYNFNIQHQTLLLKRKRNIEAVIKSLYKDKRNIAVISYMSKEVMKERIEALELTKEVNIYLNTNQLSEFSNYENKNNTIIISANDELLDEAKSLGFKTAYVDYYSNESIKTENADLIISKYTDYLNII